MEGSLTVGDQLHSRRELLRGRFLGGILRATEKAAEARMPAGGSVDRPPVAQTRRTPPVHRPPGAIPEAEFQQVCTSCGDCATACPHDAIVPAPARLRQGAGLPSIDAHTSPCWMCEDTPCITACEPGALTAEAPLAMGAARVQTLDCLAHRGTTCTTCVERCPVPNAIELDSGRPRIDPSACTGCGVCHYVCPAPRNAILILPRAS